MMQEDPKMKILALSFAELPSSSLQQKQTVGNALQTLSPLMSPLMSLIQRTHYSFQDADEVQQLKTQNEKCSS